MSGSLNFRYLESLYLFPNISPNTSAVKAPDSPKDLAKKKSTNKIPNVNMYEC